MPKPATLSEITREDFEAYEELAASGTVDMMNDIQVAANSSITRQVALGILMYHEELKAKFGAKKRKNKERSDDDDGADGMAIPGVNV